MLKKVHEGHLGITKCRERAKQSIWWPGLSKELMKMIDTCDTCARERVNLKETLIPSEFPSRPRSTAAADLFQIDSKHHLVIVDCFSRYFEVAKLSSTTSEAVIEHFKSIFACHVIPEVVRSDNGPQFGSVCFRVFAQDWGVSHVTSSPHFPQSNGEAERADTPQGTLRRNRFHLSPTSEPPVTSPDLSESSTNGSVSPESMILTVQPEGHKVSQQIPQSEKRCLCRVRAPPGYLKDLVCS
ncbi:hypothetical protein QQF64_018285 [Cirrhinus molitorella]|uniref:Gypsy retrotransposon integrase-like protein 1 n=1 Tax=Cirrhinus molitorella TaxID=172907 RepID=A0ABR3LC42_9TELE